MDLDKQVAYWRSGAEEDFEVAAELLEKGRLRHALFLAHLAIEKMLKAHVTRATADVPPRTHNLVRLADLSDLSFSSDHRRFLERFRVYQMEGRYPTPFVEFQIDPQDARQLLSGAEELLQWLSARF